MITDVDRPLKNLNSIRQFPKNFLFSKMKRAQKIHMIKQAQHCNIEASKAISVDIKARMPALCSILNEHLSLNNRTCLKTYL